MESGKWKMDNKDIKKAFSVFRFPFSICYERLADYLKTRSVR